MTAMAHNDSQVAKIVQTLEETGLMPRTTVFVLSDHGFKGVKRQIHPNAAVFRNAGLLTVQDGKDFEDRGLLGAGRGHGDGLLTVPDPSGERLKRARQALEGLEGIDR